MSRRPNKQPSKNNLIPWIVAVIIISISAVLLFNYLKKNAKSSDLDADKNGAMSSTQKNVTDSNNQNLSNQKPPVENKTELSVSDFKTGEENLPRSLQGTVVDGEIIIDENSVLVPTRGLRRLYDYFLSALGEESSETIDARVEAYITSRTPEPASSTAVALYYTYKDYLQRLSKMQDNYGDLQLRKTKAGELDLNLIKQRNQDISEIRKELFDAEAIEAFFGTDDELDAYNIAMMEIAKNTNLTEAQRQQAVKDYQSQLPDSILKQRITEKQNFQNLMTRTEALKADGASDAELFAMRAELVGIPAAERLAEVDKQNEDFDNRFNQYQQHKQQILNSVADKTQQQNQISELEQKLFSETEKKRLTGYALLKQQRAQAQTK